MQVFKVGTYKSAVEPFISTEMSPANREQVTVFLDGIWGQMLSDISESRGVSKKKTDEPRPPTMLNVCIPPMTAWQYGLADTLVYKNYVCNRTCKTIRWEYR